jgi:tRNA U34 5-carboxymethylaminomethyl modifying GTPase MnmE/TrmE
VRASLLTARNPGAIAMIAVQGEETALSRTLRSLVGGAALPAEGEVSLRTFADVDEGLLVRLRDDLAWLMPHGGVRIVERLAAALEAIGVTWIASFDESRDAFPEADDSIEAAMLSVLAEAASPVAIPLLLDQPRRWRERAALGDAARDFTEADRARWRRLDRLIDPPKACVVGPPNAGKSTLANTLAGRDIAIASPIAGTTRDFVSVRIDLAGLVVEWLDLPGFRDPDEPASDPIETAADELARRVASKADLLLLLAAPEQTWASVPDGFEGETIRAISKSDLPRASESPSAREADLAISAASGDGIAELVARVRNLLVPPGDLVDPRPWRWRNLRST